ncbi:DNA topoisomerase VI subunit B [Methanofollis formosanus]|uniref:Type 2 DNA topoisomerase 6 subunit B n=1 Tax=Methanofollis formosanus TaxID=299308 RepID=A0A8G1EGK1_9EURY|nr:DNA topoisomerase VI subunit B [Methanofollis formosanus]QYZ79890.1 DNA topoisomerase VI subunit B [Methanofollis formosanus]
MGIAEDLAKQQRSISVAEFFEKNKHLLGFDSPTRGIITTIKEAVDNALDACEEAEVLPDIYVSIRKGGQGAYRVAVEDNGPGIVPENVPNVFGKLLYGSRFHQIRQSRGQQGIGISAAVLYAQLTTGTPAVVTSRTSAKVPAHRFSLMIRTETNEPQVLAHEEVVWDRTHGTRIELEFTSSLAARKRLLEYLKYTSVVNPHARIRVEIDGEAETFERVSAEAIRPPQSIKPHPHGTELGTLKRMAAADPDRPLVEFLVDSFSKVGQKTAVAIAEAAGLAPETRMGTLGAAELKALHTAMQEVHVPPPPTSVCLSPIGEELIARGLEKEFQLDFVKARTRPAAVFSGHPFVVEAAIGYGGRLEAEGSAQLMRFANRVPLIYQQGACAITGAVAGVNWKNYNLSQSGLPTGPVLILVHVASTNVPFTSESKDAVASIPEIEREVTLVLQELGRELKAWIARRERNKQRQDRARAVCAVMPAIAEKVAEIVDKPVPDISALEGRIMRKVVARKRAHDGRVVIEVRNHTDQVVDLTIYDLSPDAGEDAVPAPSFASGTDGEYTRVWNCSLPAGERWQAAYAGTGGGFVDLKGVDDRKKVVLPFV